MAKKTAQENIKSKIETATKFDVDFKVGLTTEQVNSRIKDGLVNKSSKPLSKSYLEIILKDIFTVLNIILFTVAITLMVFGLYQRLFFTVVLILNIIISLVQDIKAKRTVDKLSLLSNPRSIVVRNGEEKDILFNDLVLSDIVILKAGNTIPCDGVLLYGTVTVNESFLSGETENVTKKVGDYIYAESYVTSGYAYIQVTRIGSANYAYKMQEKARSFSRPKSEILSSLTKIIRFVSIGAIILGILQIVTQSLRGSIGEIKIVDSITSSIVAMIPAGMYLTTSITLAVGIIILGRKKILVKEMYSIEMLARVNVICFDKTGTLTDGKMIVKELIPINSNEENIANIIGQLLYLTHDDNLTAAALKNRFPTIPVLEDAACIPFDSAKKFSAASFNNKTYVLGAFGFFNIKNSKDIEPIVRSNENKGYRVMVLSYSNHNIKDNKIPSDLIAIGIIVISENIKSDAKDNIKWFKDANVDMRIISGDSMSSLMCVAKEVGLTNCHGVSLEGKSDEEVKELAHSNEVFGRVTPEQKRILIEELRNMGNTVAMVGDGVNDILALKAANCSIAMANGADAAKSVSHLIALDSNFSSLPNVVLEGRKVINNIERVCSIFLVKTFFAFFMSFFFLICSWFTENLAYPYVSNNLMCWELLTIGLAPLLLAIEPNKERIKRGFMQNVISETLPGGIFQVVVSLPAILTAISLPDIFDVEGTISITVITMTIMSLVILLHVCLPLNRYRAKVLGITAFLICVVFAIDTSIYFTIGTSILGVKYTSMNLSSLLLGLLVFIVSIPAYFYVCHIIAKKTNKKAK